jgi:hypothetical protein
MNARGLNTILFSISKYIYITKTSKGTAIRQEIFVLFKIQHKYRSLTESMARPEADGPIKPAATLTRQQNQVSSRSIVLLEKHAVA